MKKERILVCCALPDDAAVGAGGTIAKYSREGKKVRTLIFSYGEMSAPHLQPEVVREMHSEEAEEADKLLGGSGVHILGLTEGQFVKQCIQPKMRKVLKDILEKEKPDKIFIHAEDDPQPGHRAVHKIVCSMVKAIGLKTELYSFDVWSPYNFKHRDKPKLIVDISTTFKQKIKAIEAHKSQQRLFVGQLMKVKSYVKDYFNGFNHNTKYAEVFVKLH